MRCCACRAVGSRRSVPRSPPPRRGDRPPPPAEATEPAAEGFGVHRAVALTGCRGGRGDLRGALGEALVGEGLFVGAGVFLVRGTDRTAFVVGFDESAGCVGHMGFVLFMGFDGFVGLVGPGGAPGLDGFMRPSAPVVPGQGVPSSFRRGTPACRVPSVRPPPPRVRPPPQASPAGRRTANDRSGHWS